MQGLITNKSELYLPTGVYGNSMHDCTVHVTCAPTKQKKTIHAHRSDSNVFVLAQAGRPTLQLHLLAKKQKA